MHEVLSRWEQHYLSLNPIVYYQQLSCPIGLFYSESEVAGLLSKRLSEFTKVFNMANQAHLVRHIKHVDRNFITIDQGPKAASSAFFRTLVEEASKLI